MYKHKVKRILSLIYRKFMISTRQIIVIYYHNIVEDGEGLECQKIDISKFTEEMKFLKEQGYNTISLYDLNKKNINERTILITFDDGFKSVYTKAFEVLKKYNLKAGVFVNNDFVNVKNNNYLDWNDIKLMECSQVFSFGAHTKSHIDIRTINKKNYTLELIESKQEIEEKLGHKIDSLCFPYGKYNYKCLKNLKSDKIYKFLFTSQFGSFKLSNHEVQLIPRIAISNNDDIKDFQDKLNGFYNYIGYIQRIKRILEI